MSVDFAAVGSLPAYDMAPQDYRYALDAAISFIAGANAVLLRCHVPALAAEALQRRTFTAEHDPTRAALLIEPQVHSWREDLHYLRAVLPPGAPLAVVASRPLARLLPERRAWPDAPLGLSLAGMIRLRRGLRQAGFAITAEYGTHTAQAIALNMLGGQLARRGRPELADRLLFAARLRYCAAGPSAALATVALLLARREER